MKPIMPIVGVSKIMSSYRTFVCGIDGVLSKGEGMLAEPLKALQAIYETGKDVILFSNSPLRVCQVVESLRQNSFDLCSLKAVVTAGEILHYKLKGNTSLGKKYYNFIR